MAMNEAKVRELIGAAVSEVGSLTIAETKRVIGGIKLSAYDKAILPSSETTPRFEKIIGNIVSHQVEPIQEYDEGFICDKTCRPAVFAKANMTLTEFARYRSPHRMKRDS